MRIGCPACKAAYDVDDAQVPPEGLGLQCSSCGGNFVVRKPAASHDAPVPLPGAAAPRPPDGAIPLPGAAPAPRAFSPPSPQITPPPPVGGAVPLPGASGPGAFSGAGAIPLPGTGAPPPPPDPFAFDLGGPDDAVSGTAVGFGGFDLSTPGANPTPGAAVDELDFGEGEFGAFSEPGGDLDPFAAPPPPPSGGFDPFASAPPPPPAGAIGGDAFSIPPLSPENLFGDVDPAVGIADLSPSAGDRALPDLELTLPPLVEAPATAAAAQATSDLLRDFLLEDDAPPAVQAAPPPQPTNPNGPPPPMFHVRRKSGKRIGPFDHETLVRLVRQDQLDGTEDISADGEEWSPLAEVPDVATLLRNRPAPKPRVAPPMMPVLQRGVVVEEPVVAPPPEPEPSIAETLEVVTGGKVRLPFSPSRKLVAAVGGGLAGVALIGGGAWFFLGGEEAAPPAEDAAQAAAKEAQQLRDQKARQEKRAAAAKELENARAALDRGDVVEAQRRIAEALSPDAAAALEKNERAGGLFLAGEIALRARDAAAAEKTLRDAIGQGSEPARAALGRFLVARRRGADAVEVLKARGEDAAIAPLLLEAQLLAGGVTAAEAWLQPLEKKAAKGVPLSLLRGRILRESGKLPEALASVQKAVAADPKAAAQIELVKVQLETGRPDDEGAAVERIHAIFAAIEPDAAAAQEKRPVFAPSELAELQVTLGLHRLSQGNADAALAAFEKAASLDPTDDRAVAGRGAVRLLAGDLDGAKAAFDEAVAINDASAEGLAGLGRIALRQKDWDTAIAHLTKARTLSPKDAMIGVHLADAQLGGGKTADALHTIDAVIEARDDVPDARATRAEALLAKGDYEGAESEARRAISLDKKVVRYPLLLARIHEKVGAPAAALSAYKEALALAPGDVDALEGQGKAKIATGAILDGVKGLEAALAKDPERTHLLEPIADGYLRSRKFQQAIDTIEKQQRLTGAKGLSFKLARALQELGRTDLAIAQFHKSIVEDPSDATAQRFLGYAYKEKNQIRKAVEAFQAYLSMSPNADDRAEIEDEIATLR